MWFGNYLKKSSSFYPSVLCFFKYFVPKPVVQKIQNGATGVE
jgi:hypothetical protein